MALETKITWNGKIKKAQMSDSIQRSLIRSTNLVQAYAKRTITENKNVDTGNLRSSIVKMVDAMNMIGIVSTNVEYAKYIEFGTRYHQAWSFMRKSLNDNKDTIRKIFISEGSEAVDK